MMALYDPQPEPQTEPQKCPRCGALPGEFCTTEAGGRAKKPHSGFNGSPVVEKKPRPARPFGGSDHIVSKRTLFPVPRPPQESPRAMADPDRYRRATFNFARAAREVFESQKYIGTGVARTALVDLQFGLDFVSQFVTPSERTADRTSVYTASE